jgi:hypothetical protein
MCHLPQAFDLRFNWDCVMQAHVSLPLLVESSPSSSYESDPGSLSHVQDQNNGILPWLPLGWRNNDLAILDIKIKHI